MRWLFLVVLLFLPLPAAAQGWIEPLVHRGGAPVSRVERLRTSVTVRVTDRVARVEVEEWFRNNGGGTAEGDYIYPLPGETVFSDFSLFQGEDELKGETMDASKARAIYEEIVRRRRDPALIELAGNGLLRARVFPFGPNETRNVRLRYTQVLDRAGDALRFRYIGSRARQAGAVTPTGSARTDGAPLTFTLVADNASRYGAPFSPTHRLQVTRDKERLSVRPAASPDGSFEVFLPLATAGVGISLAAHRVNGEDGYFMLTLSPGAARGVAEPRDVAVVVDTSGSMSGEKIEQAREALRQLLGSLGPKDRFRMVSFANQVQSHRPEWADATRAALDDARAWIDRLSASGGTNISGALDEVLRTPPGSGRMHIVVFLTDGQPTVGEENPDRIAARVEAVAGNARIFTFGVGYDLNTYLLERIAVAGRGTVDYVAPGRKVEDAVGSLANRIRMPVLVDLSFAGSPVRLKDVQPSRLPDLYAGQDLVVFGRYESAGGNGAGPLTIAGRRGGQGERYASRVEFPAHASTGDYIPGLWAARKLGELTRNIRIEGSTPARVAEIKDLALRYGLLSEYTAYLVQEPQTAALRAPAALVPLVPGGGGGGGRAGGVGGGSGGGFGVAPPPAQPPVTQVTGEAAVESAKAASLLRDARSQSEVAEAQRAVVDGLTVTSARQRSLDPAGARIVAGRTFRLVSAIWTDTAHSDQSRVVAVEPFSQASFKLLEKLPELTPYLSAFEAVIVRGRDVSIRVAPGGRSTLTAGELDALARDFRPR
jgi:Ca-activated chloride channel family protein